MVLTVAFLFVTFPEPVQKIIDLALANSPEIAADALIQLSPYAGSRDGSVELLERASALARSAVHPYPRGSGLFHIEPESDAGRLNAAVGTDFAGHALEVRAARALFKLDARRGADALLRMHPPRFPPLQCKDALSWRTGEYYDLVRDVFSGGFTPQEKRDGKHVAMLEDQVRALTSPFQLEPLARLLVQVQVTDVQFDRLVAVYAGAVKSLSPDDRSFTSSTRHGFTQAIYDLMGRCRKSGVPVTPVLEAYRSYIERGLTGQRCKDSTAEQGEGAVLANVVMLLNGTLKEADMAPLNLADRRPHVVNEQARLRKFWTSPTPRALHARLASLRRETDKTGERWERLVREYLVDLATWTPDQREATRDYFHQRALLYAGVLQLLPAGALRSGAVSEYLAFLAGSPVQRESPPEWYLYVRDLRNSIGTEEIHRIGHPGLLLPLQLSALLR